MGTQSTLWSHSGMMRAMKSGTRKQLASWSLVGWTAAGTLFFVYFVAANKRWEDAFFTGVLIAAVLILGAGTIGLGVGGSQASSTSASYSPHTKMEQPGARLTSLGAALVVLAEFGLALGGVALLSL